MNGKPVFINYRGPNKARDDARSLDLRHTELKRTARVRRFVDFLTDELNALKPLA